MNENKNIENVTEKNNKKSGPPILYVIVLIVFAIIMIASIYFGTISPIISAIHDIGIIMVVLRAFGAVGSFLWFAVFYHILNYFGEKGKGYAVSVVLSLLIIFFMICTVFLF